MDDCVTPTPTPVGDSMMEDEDSEFSNDYENYVESEEDVDCREMPEDVKIMHHNLYMTYRDEPHFHHYFSSFYEDYPLKYPNYFDKVKRHPGDDQLLVDRHVPWITEHRHPIHARETLAKNVVAEKLSNHAKFHELKSLWNKVRAVSLATCDHFFANTTNAAASLLYRLYTMDYLYKIGRKRTLDDQKIELWDEIELMLKKVCSIYEACQKIVHLVEDKDKYSFLTECDVAEMLGGYHRQLGLADGFHRPFFTGETYHHYTELEFDQVKIQILKDINDVVMQMEVPSIFQVDDYTRMLIHILRRPEWEEWGVVDLVKDAMKIFDIDSTDGKETIICLLDDLYHGVKNSMKLQLADAVQPLYLLSMNILGLRHVSREILMIVQIAELRRMALGCRFIGRSHLIWAFYECGYGLPKIRKAILNSHDRDHPPYHIYVATMKIAKAYCLKKARLEHFIFAVLFAVDNIFDCSEKKWTGLLQDFQDFTEDISLVRTEVEPKSDPRVSATSPMLSPNHQ